MEQPAYFELNFKPNVALVSVVRRFVTEFYQRVLDDADGTSRVAMATHELLENAVKYSIDGETTIRIVVSHDTPRAVKISMRNRADAQHIAALREILDGASRSGDAQEFYQQAIGKSARSPSGSGLGLARIFAEAEMKLVYEVIGDAIVIDGTTHVGTR